MLSSQELKQCCPENSIVQVITEHTTGIGRLVSILDTAIVIEDHGNEKLKEEYGSYVPVPTIIPIKTIQLILLIEKGEIINGV